METCHSDHLGRNSFLFCSQEAVSCQPPSVASSDLSQSLNQYPLFLGSPQPVTEHGRGIRAYPLHPMWGSSNRQSSLKSSPLGWLDFTVSPHKGTIMQSPGVLEQGRTICSTEKQLLVSYRALSQMRLSTGPW